MDHEIPRGARTAMQTEYLGLVAVVHFHQEAIPELVFEILSILIANGHVLSMISSLKPMVQI